jgi:dUTP pyrophosphatase
MLKVKRLNEYAKLPKRQTDGSAGYDIYSAEECLIGPGEQKIISTGISIELPICEIPNHIYSFQIISRSGLSAKYKIEKGAGLIDADYNGEIKVILYNYSKDDNVYKINIGDRIAQGIIVAVAIPQVMEVNEIKITDRGIGGFGSTGK